MAGKKIAIVTGQTVTFGRAAGRAEFPLPHDTFMSGVHFAVECAASGCRVVDRKSSNGTFLNGARVQDAMLANGDEIKGGQTIFAVKIVSDAKLASFLPPQEVAPPSASPPPPPAVEPFAGEQRPHQADPALPALPPSAAPVVPRVARPEERKPAPVDAAAVASPPARAPLAEPQPPSPVLRTADQFGGAAKPHPASDVDHEPGARKSPGAPALPVGDSPSSPVGPAKNVPPPLEEPPRFHAIPSVPRPASAGSNPPRGGEKPPEVAAKPPRSAEPPPGVAPYIAEKFAERPGTPGAGIPRGFAFSVMGWSFPAAPAEWQVQEGFGLQQSGHEEFPSSVAVTEELLGGITLQQFVESQISMLRGYLRDPKIEPTMPPRVGGADESMAVDVRHSTKDGRELVYRRIYARSGASVGVLTVTTLAADLPQVLLSLQPLLDGAAFRSTVHN
jgi:hypothetical protein